MAEKETREDLPPAQFFNFMRVMSTASEFYLELGQTNPGQPTTEEEEGQKLVAVNLITRVVTTPRHMKAMIRALKDNLDKFEKQHGEIPEETPKR